MYGTYHYGDDDNAFSIARSCAAKAQGSAMRFYATAGKLQQKYEDGFFDDDIAAYERLGDKYAADAEHWYNLARLYSGAYSTDIVDYPEEPARDWVEPGYVGDGFSQDRDEYHPVYGYPEEPFYNDYDYDADEDYGDEPDECESVYCPICGEEMFCDICDTCEEDDESL